LLWHDLAGQPPIEITVEGTMKKIVYVALNLIMPMKNLFIAAQPKHPFPLKRRICVLRFCHPCQA